MLTVEDAAERLHIAERSVRDWIKGGKLRANKSGRKWLIAEAEVDRLLGRSPATRLENRTEDFVYQQARLAHIGKLAGVSMKLQKGLEPPGSCDIASWVPNGEQAVYSGSLPPGIKRGYSWKTKGTGPGIFQLAVEDDPYFPCLKAHLPDPNLWSKFLGWEQKAAEYLGSGRELLKAIINGCEQRVGSRLSMDSEWPQEGISWHFSEQVFIHYTYLAQNSPGIAGWGYQHSKVQSRLPEQGLLHRLSHGSDEIACHSDANVLGTLEELHAALLSENNTAWTSAARDLAHGHKQLKDLCGPIKKTLEIEIERGTFEHGRCMFCP